MATFMNVSPVVSESLSENDIKKLALEAILENPQIVMDAINLLRDLDEANKETSKKQAYLNNKEILTSDIRFFSVCLSVHLDTDRDRQRDERLQNRVLKCPL